MKEIFTIIGAIVTGMLLGFILAAIPTLLWFCFDDTLADVLGNPKLANLPFWTVFAFTYFLTCVFKSSTNNCKK